MAREVVEAKYQLKDEHGNTLTDEEGKANYSGVQVEYDFGDDLDGAVALAGAEVVFSNYKANSKVALQSIMRAKNKAGVYADTIQAFVDTWKPGMVIERTAVAPENAIMNAFPNWSDEKKAEFLAKLGVEM